MFGKFETVLVGIFATVLIGVFVWFNAIDSDHPIQAADFSFKMPQIIEVELPEQYLTGTDGACLAAAMKIQMILLKAPKGSLVKLTNKQSWYPFIHKKLISLREVNELVDEDRNSDPRM
jgi:hypothetical protein